MATATATATATARAPSPSGESSCVPSFVLLHAHAQIGGNRNNTTASCITANGLQIFASFFPEQPSRPSNLYVDCPGGDLFYAPRLFAMVNDLIIFNVYIGSKIRRVCAKDCDFFIYRADPKRPSLRRLPHPGFRLRQHQVGIVPRGDDHFIIIALADDPCYLSNNTDELKLVVFDSEAQIWTSELVRIKSLRADLPMEIPIRFNYRMMHHSPSCVITLGSGTVGWVHLWRNIIFCDGLAADNHFREIRDVPLPLPLAFNHPTREALGHPRIYRGICFIDDCLWLTEVEWDIVEFPGQPDPETKYICSRMEGWTVTTWSNTKMTNSYDDWVKHKTLRASEIAFDIGHFSESGMPAVDMHRLFVSDPVFGINNSGIVYLTARLKFMGRDSWIIAVDLENHKVQSVVNSGPLPQGLPCIEGSYCNCSIYT